MAKKNISELKITPDEAAELLDLPRRTFFQWVKDGRLPASDDGAYNLGELVRAFAAVEEDENNLTAQKTRLTRAQAEKAELEIETLKGNLLRAPEVKKLWAKYISNTKNKLLALASKLSPQLEGLEPAAIQAKIRAEITAALNELKNV